MGDKLMRNSENQKRMLRCFNKFLQNIGNQKIEDGVMRGKFEVVCGNGRRVPRVFGVLLPTIKDIQACIELILAENLERIRSVSP
jgi:hypothetical protein